MCHPVPEGRYLGGVGSPAADYEVLPDEGEERADHEGQGHQGQQGRATSTHPVYSAHNVSRIALFCTIYFCLYIPSIILK